MPLIYLEIGGLESVDSSGNGATRAACKNAVAAVLRASVGHVLRRRDRVAAGPGARWFIALLVDRAATAEKRETAADADLGVAAMRLRSAAQAALDDVVRGRALSARLAVCSGWTVVERIDASRPLQGLRQAIRGAAVLARVEERRALVLAAVTHELRTPLTSIIGYIERLRDASLSPRQSGRYISIVTAEARRLHRLVDGLIDVGSWSAGNLRLQRESANLRELAEAAWLSVAKLASERHLKWEVTGGAELMLDRERMLQVLINLLDNAVRHAKQRGSVRLQIMSSNGTCSFRVSDNGRGFDAGIKRMLGQPFCAGAGGHVGLGLAIARLLVEAHGGRLRIGGSARKGACVVVDLPVEQPHRPGG